MVTLLLINTGATEIERQGRIKGTLDVALSEQGKQQVSDIAAALIDSEAKITALYAGPCRAAQETADILCVALDLKCKTSKDIRSLDHGLWQGMLVDDVRTRQPKVYRQWSEKPDTVCPPEGETLQHARERLSKFIEKAAKKHKSCSIAVVLDRPIAALLKGLVLGSPVAELWNNGHDQEPQWEPIEVAELPA